MQDLVAGERRVGEVDGLDVLGQALDEDAAQHRLAAPDLACDLDDPFVVGDRVQQRLQRGAAVRTREEELGVGGDPEGGLVEPEMAEVHCLAYLYCRPRPAA